MKILVCTDGSEQSLKALKKAVLIAQGCKANDVAVIHVYDGRQDVSPLMTEAIKSEKQVDKFLKMVEEHQQEREKILADARDIFADKGIKARFLLKEGHPAHTIIETACDEGFDMIVLGSRGLGGLKKLFLGSVSNAVVQEAKNCDVLTVK